MDKGFTLIEILVVMFIIVILTGVLSINLPKGRQQFVLQRAAHTLIQDLRKVQEMAMSTEEKDCSGGGKANGFGIFFDEDGSSKKKYILFANCDESYNYNENADKILEKIDLEQGTEIFSLSPGPLCSVVFVSPSPTTYINNFAGPEAQIVISLENDISQIKVIKINSAGLIEITN